MALRSGAAPDLFKKYKKGKSGNDELAYEQTPEISLYAEAGDGEEHSGDAHEQPDEVDKESKCCLSQSVDGAHQSCVGIHKRADPRKSDDEFSCGTAVEKDRSDKVSENKKEQAA